MQDYEIVDHTADVSIIVHGEELREVFANAARAMFSLIVDLDAVGETIYREVKVSGDDEEVLLVEWLNELLYLFDAQSIVFKKFEILDLSRTALRAKVYGEEVNPSHHKLKMGIKAATYHMLRVEKCDGFKAQVLFDV
jgi:SHS2 domain-containing protein